MGEPLKGTSNLAREFTEKICLYIEGKLGFPPEQKKPVTSQKPREHSALGGQRVVPCEWKAAESGQVCAGKTKAIKVLRDEFVRIRR